MTTGQIIIACIKMKENDGLTLRNYLATTYKSGWQVATEGIQTTNPVEAGLAAAKFEGNCGIWFSNGVYYVDKSQRVNTKHEAMEIGRKHNQISILNWKTMELAYC